LLTGLSPPLFPDPLDDRVRCEELLTSKRRVALAPPGTSIPFAE
jgi:hypothetical protein